MTEEEARTLADRIIATWPAGAKHFIWKRTLLENDCELDVAETAYRIMRDSAISTPTTGAYMNAYRQAYARHHQHPSTLFAIGDDAIGRDEYLRRNPPATVHELKRWTNERMRLNDVIKTLNDKEPF